MPVGDVGSLAPVPLIEFPFELTVPLKTPINPLASFLFKTTVEPLTEPVKALWVTKLLFCAGMVHESTDPLRAFPVC